jgi:hypothetical protein
MLDWRPYDYLTLRNTVPTPMGTVQFVETTEFEPTPTGTTLHWRFAPPRSAKGRTVLTRMRPYLEQAMGASAARLAELLAAHLAERAADVVVEPTLPEARPGAITAGIATQPGRLEAETRQADA